MDKGVVKDRLTFMISNVILYTPEIMIDFSEILDELLINVER